MNRAKAIARCAAAIERCGYSDINATVNNFLLWREFHAEMSLNGIRYGTSHIALTYARLARRCERVFVPLGPDKGGS